MQRLDTFLDLDQLCIDCNNIEENVAVSNLKNRTNSFLSLSDILDTNNESSMSSSFSTTDTEHKCQNNYPNQELQMPATSSSSSSSSSISDSSSQSSSDAFQLNFVSQLFPLFKSLLKGLNCSCSTTPLSTSTACLNHQVPPVTCLAYPNSTLTQLEFQEFFQSMPVMMNHLQQEQLFNVQNNYQQIVNSSSPPPTRQPTHNQSNKSLTVQQLPHKMKNQTNSCQTKQEFSRTSKIVNCQSPPPLKTSRRFSKCETSPVVSTTSQQHVNKIKKSKKTKSTVGTKIVLCNNEYEEKMFKLRNPNQTYYKFVER